MTRMHFCQDSKLDLPHRCPSVTLTIKARFQEINSTTEVLNYTVS